MATKLDCPLCGRRLVQPGSPGIVICDGCEGEFDPKHLVYRFPSVFKQVLGWVIVFAGARIGIPTLLEAFIFFTVAINVTFFGLLALRLIIAVGLIAWGLSLTKGTMVIPGQATDNP
jgi:hypothetical protein